MALNISQKNIELGDNNMKTKIIVYKVKKGETEKGIYVNEDHKGYFVLPEGKTRKKHIKFSQVIKIEDKLKII